MLSRNVPPELQPEICRVWGVIHGQHYTKKYLGLPSIIGQAWKRTFVEIKRKVAQKLQCWKGQMLSQEGNEVLLKIVALAFPDLLNEMLSTLRWLVEGVGITYGKILEGQKNSVRKIYWIGWQKLCKPKIQGELGFGDLKSFNLTLLAK